MKLRKIFIGLLVLSAVVLLAACNQTGNGSSDDNHEHTYASEWTTTDLFHWHDSTCGHEDEIKDKNYHEWDNGVVTTEPTTTSSGVKTFTCTVCGKTKTQELPKVEGPAHEHTYSSDWSKDETHHWHAATCEHTTEVSGKAEHNWNDGVVTTEPTYEAAGVKTYTCTDCGQTKEEAVDQLVHEHTYSSDWSKDETHHWHAATCEHSTEVSGKAEHNWNDGVVTTDPTTEADGVKTYTCTDCGQTKEEAVPAIGHEHTFSAEWSKDETHHWHSATCAHTNEVSGKAEHNWNDGVVTTEPTEENTGVKTYTCTDCGQTKEETLDKLEHVHSHSTTWSHDENNHWHECACGDKTDLASHTGGTATTTEKAVCSVCGASYGDLLVVQDITLGFWTNDYSNSDGYTIYIYVWNNNGDAWFKATLTDDNGAFGDYYTVTLTGYTESNLTGFIVVRTTGPDWGKKVQQSADLAYADYLATLARDGKVTYYL